MIHTCTDCGLVHDAALPPAESPEVAIARINAENALALAKINSRTDRDIAETYAESDVQVAEAQADAIGDVLALEQEAAEDAPAGDPPAEDPAPVVVNAPILDSGNDEVQPPPEHEASHDEEPKPKRGGLFANW